MERCATSTHDQACLQACGRSIRIRDCGGFKAAVWQRRRAYEHTYTHIRTSAFTHTQACTHLHSYWCRLLRFTQPRLDLTHANVQARLRANDLGLQHTHTTMHTCYRQAASRVMRQHGAGMQLAQSPNRLASMMTGRTMHMHGGKGDVVCRDVHCAHGTRAGPDDYGCTHTAAAHTPWWCPQEPSMAAAQALCWHPSPARRESINGRCTLARSLRHGPRIGEFV